jgi:hypothetical protein
MRKVTDYIGQSGRIQGLWPEEKETEIGKN